LPRLSVHQVPHSEYHQQYEVSKISIFRGKKKDEEKKEKEEEQKKEKKMEMEMEKEKKNEEANREL
jgi:hypothetical protein